MEHKSPPKDEYDKYELMEESPHPGVKISSPVVSLPKNSEEVDKAISTIKDLYASYKDRYGIEVNFDINSAIDNFQDILVPEKRKIFELALYDTIDKIRLVAISKLSVSILVIINKITSADFIDSLDVRDLVALNDRLFSQLDKVSKLRKLLKPRDVDIEMRNVLNNQTEDRFIQDRDDELAILKAIDDITKDREDKDKDTNANK